MAWDEGFSRVAFTFCGWIVESLLPTTAKHTPLLIDVFTLPIRQEVTILDGHLGSPIHSLKSSKQPQVNPEVHTITKPREATHNCSLAHLGTISFSFSLSFLTQTFSSHKPTCHCGLELDSPFVKIQEYFSCFSVPMCSAVMGSQAEHPVGAGVALAVYILSPPAGPKAMRQCLPPVLEH